MRVVIDIPSEDPVALVERAWGLVEGVVLINLSIMRRVRIPPLYTAGVPYMNEPDGPEEFANCLQVLGLAPRLARPGKWADCDDAVAYRVAELRMKGEPAQARIVWRKMARHSKHAQVRRGDGSIEDPCMILRRNQQEGRIGCVV